MENKGFTYFSDPSHGWVCVSIADLKALGLTPKDFTGYSYCDGNDVYLEEDVDAMKFISKYNEVHKTSPLIYEQHLPSTNNFIRRMSYNEGNVKRKGSLWKVHA